ncbi:PREDICTED: histone-lysine N-methyltransferase ASHR2 [Nelumbo nucifera]|uniref:Histone-lysine N-methyltransferase ASHR2 n=2 Tax=Nelumbo nucifera TaxID=4432 RepID=A0A1U7ZLP8_NELNU|nr:PREDICTED: histone-lysine N-methyltransferase ASHR2 [Nelumbo nucifera]XP_010249393.1 PREDICTED: histone-lysine N-methyltransferase ASHR2 [Nelumbo nucifera]DAD30330.1 TPA_asm: hypothetical protein HUJ06_009181 [Nelumbo nucifera]
MLQPPNSIVKLVSIPGKGRGMVSTQPIKPGQVLLRDSPVLLYSATPSLCKFCSHCFRLLPQSPFPCPTCSHCALFCSSSCLSLALSSSHSPWSCHSLISLSLSPPLPPDLHTQAFFLIAAYNLSLLSAPDFHALLSLHGDPPESLDAPTLFLHSLISSFGPPPGLTGFSPEMTAALLAKDKANAFGLMEPFKETGERAVRAYGIYPNASFFNHDCLPNACRFDYVDGVGDGNTDIIVRAVHEVPEGREICLSYFPVNWRYKERQTRLREDYGFECGCDRCRVEVSWSDDEEDGIGEEEMTEEDGEEQMEGVEDEDGDGEGSEVEFPHAYFFLRYVCDRDNCGGTLAPLPPSEEGVVSGVMECNACGRLREEESVGREGC